MSNGGYKIQRICQLGFAESSGSRNKYVTYNNTVCIVVIVTCMCNRYGSTRIPAFVQLDRYIHVCLLFYLIDLFREVPLSLIYSRYHWWLFAHGFEWTTTYNVKLSSFNNCPVTLDVIVVSRQILRVRLL